jgi:chromosome partitioning protein
VVHPLFPSLAAHLARALHLKGQTALLADADAQGSARDWHKAGRPAVAFVVTRAKKGTLLAREVADAIKTYGFPILQGSIYDRTIFARSMADGSTAMDDEPAGPAAWEIHHLLNQIQEAFDV